MTSILTRAPAGTTMSGLVMPAMRNVSSGPEGLARIDRRTVVVAKVMVFAARSIRALAGTWLPSAVARAALTRGPGAFAHRRPMIFPGSALVPIMAPGRVPPRIQPGALVPPVIHWYPAALIIQPPPDPPIMV